MPWTNSSDLLVRELELTEHPPDSSDNCSILWKYRIALCVFDTQRFHGTHAFYPVFINFLKFEIQGILFFVSLFWVQMYTSEMRHSVLKSCFAINFSSAWQIVLQHHICLKGNNSVDSTLTRFVFFFVRLRDTFMLVRSTSVFILVQISLFFFHLLFTLMKEEWGISDFITTITAEMCIKLEMCQWRGFDNNSDRYRTTTDMSISSLCLTSASIGSNKMLPSQVHSKTY